MVTPGVRGASPRRLRWIAVGQIVLWGAIGLGAFLLLAKSVQNSPEFGRLQLWILLFDICAVIALSVLLARKLWRLVRDYRAHVPGSRLTARTVAIFGSLVIAPLLIVYLFSLDFLNRGVLITPFHSMLLMCPATTSEDVDRYSSTFAGLCGELSEA